MKTTARGTHFCLAFALIIASGVYTWLFAAMDTVAIADAINAEQGDRGDSLVHFSGTVFDEAHLSIAAVIFLAGMVVFLLALGERDKTRTARRLDEKREESAA